LRVQYFYYALPAIPAFALAIALAAQAMPRWLIATYLVAVLGGFAWYFPFLGVRA
jgi:hypothetical protein